ncbi:LuxR C-terminal-related transcriptional regulator [Sphingomonas sp. S1-29]|uniref:response regulator transcription factor n=1 Tax=Sphingomonas sp. S1-29 TaxID=2991074 RepID=UPI00223F259E|nr:LuxR C-terminal-related transcriptional regulator [Sphingomonas sp. S1-29]UZK70417.1 LuxR C-terminal-related transcriptional regulator [Sphingomonas sp. S1-29]
MSKPLSVVLVCQGSLFCEMIGKALKAEGMTVSASTRNFQVAAKTVVNPADVGIYVDTHHSADGEQLAAMAANVPVANWIVMHDENDSDFYSAMVARGKPACSVPTDLSCEALGHLVALAAEVPRICIGEQNGIIRYQSRSKAILTAKLDRGQKELLQLISQGMSNKEIARGIACTENTVKMRVRALLTKLGVANRTQAGVLAAWAECIGCSQPSEAQASGLYRRRKDDQASLFN